jgi:hypothetical protein
MAPDDVHSDDTWTFSVMSNPYTSCPTCGLKKPSRGMEILDRNANWAPDKNPFAEWFTRYPNDDRPSAVPVLYPRLI